jgi:hypothetical protein
MKGVKIGTYPEKLSMLRRAAKLWISGTIDLQFAKMFR